MSYFDDSDDVAEELALEDAHERQRRAQRVQHPDPRDPAYVPDGDDE